MVNWITSLFGENMPPAVGVIAMFALAILAIGLLLWIARRILGGTFVAGGRARHLRLAVMDATPVDSRRRLVLVRRDDVEHLILIGGPTDLVVEQNIRLSPAPAAKQPGVASSTDNTPAKAPSDIEPTFSDRSQPVKTVQSPPPRPTTPPMTASERPAAPPRPAPAAPIRPAAIPPRPFEPQFKTPPAPPPPRPVPAYVPPTSGPAAGLSGASYQPRPITPTAATPAAAPAVTPPQAATTEVASEPKVAKLDTSEPKLVAAAAAPLAGAVLANEVQPSVPDPDHSLLLDLSDEIARVAGSESEAGEISLEEEMESLLADLDVKAERAT